MTGEPAQIAPIIRSEQPRLVLLDMILPGWTASNSCRGSPNSPDLPVIFISGYGRDETVAAALEAGAADYIVKPFSQTELVARVRAALRRREEPGPFVLGELAIDFARRRVSVGSEQVALTQPSMNSCACLPSTPDGWCPTARCCAGSGDSATARTPTWCASSSRTSRRKLGEDAANPAWIFNERGVGYRMAEPGED